jgi:hypothetical protein
MSEEQPIEGNRIATVGHQENKTAADAKTGFKDLSSGIKGSFEDKEAEYAKRIIAGEDPASMGVPGPLQEGVRRKIDELQQKKPESEQPVEEQLAESHLDFGTTEEELEEQKAKAREAMAETQSATPLDFGDTEEEIEAQKAAKRATMAESHLDFGDTEEEIEAQKAMKRAEMYETPASQEDRQLTVQERFYNFLHRKDAKEERAQVEALSQELFDRVDRDKLLNDPEFIYSADQYRELLTIRNGVTEGKHNGQGFLENRAIRSSLEGIRRRWEERGLLGEPQEEKDEPVTTETPLTSEQLADKRRGLRLNIQTAFDQRDKFFMRFPPGESDTDYASEIGNTVEILDLENEKREVYPSLFGYEAAEYDDAFLDAIAKRTQKLFDQQRHDVKNDVIKQYGDEKLFGEPITEEQFEYITERIAPRVAITPAPAQTPPAA